MQLRFLGTSAGVPTRTRNVSALALTAEGQRRWTLIDCGEGTQQQLMRTPLSAARLEAVFITHIHGDHCYGLPGLLASASMAGRQTALIIVGPQAVRDYLEAVTTTTGLHLGFDLIHVDAATLVDNPLTLSDITVRTARLSHGVECYAYALEERHVEASLNVERLKAEGVTPGPLWGRLQRGETVIDEQGRQLSGADYRLPARTPRRLVVAGDNDTPDLLAPICQDADVLVHEATYTEAVIEQRGTDNGHSSAARIAAFAERAGLAQLVLTHFSPRYVSHPGATPSISDIDAEARAHFGGALMLAEDLAVFDLSRDHRLYRCE
ncbi:ribonuclease Z [Kushneria phyllosphaerae]|uniref:Ribonuclease Z n=1 Tax=Kushneria phyllosphaerae TaxID=2100822 RepID=A0A2R8CH74_9GAMM|nr:ribonuclease Z [Kushneria phyllosphaerae]SPJ32236.1 Ribonuclease BN [Kushneria phyllosphaerae]